MLIRILILFLLSDITFAKVFDLPYDMKLDVKGYAGYKYITGTSATNFLPSIPEAGGLLNLQVNEHLSLYNQVVYSQNDGKFSPMGSLAYSFAALDFDVFKDANFTLRAGRLRHDVGLYNNIRLNPRTRQGVVMPQSIYWDSLNLILISGDGINVAFKFKGLEINYTIDAPIIHDKLEEANVWAPHLLNTVETSFGSHQLISTAYEFDTFPLRIKADWATLNLGSNYTTAFKRAYPSYINKDMSNEIVTAGIEYKGSNLTLAAETLIFKPVTSNWSETNRLSTGYSYTASYAITDEVTGRVNYNEFDSQSNSNKGFHPNYAYAKDFNVGLVWHKDNWQVGAEIHKIKGGRWVNHDDFDNNPSSYTNWYMFATNIVYFFD